jgi:hypothetical protein
MPSDARVDPSQFPEDEFPLVCPKCDYSLRGLPSDICPECGSQFDRGRLLVEQYAIERGKRHLVKRDTLATILTFIWIITSLFGVAYFIILFWDPNKWSIPSILFNATWLPKLFGGVAGICSLGFVVMDIRRFHRLRHLVKRVTDAIDKTAPAYHKAERVNWVLIVVIGFCGSGTYAYYWLRSDWRFFSRHPLQTVVPLVVVFAVGLLVWWIRRKKRS